MRYTTDPYARGAAVEHYLSIDCGIYGSHLCVTWSVVFKVAYKAVVRECAYFREWLFLFYGREIIRAIVRGVGGRPDFVTFRSFVLSCKVVGGCVHSRSGSRTLFG